MPQTFSTGNKLVYGQRGTVLGPGSSEERILVMFQGYKGRIHVAALELSKGKPLAGGFVASDDVYFVGTSQATSSGDKLAHGQRGKVVGPGSSEPDKRVAVMFFGNKGSIDITVPMLSKEAPKPLAGGFMQCLWSTRCLSSRGQ